MNLVLLAAGSIEMFLFGAAMFLTAVFLMLLVLVQRGRGGGLSGAFGGAGGQSAFGAKAGDTFTKVTIYASTFWILLCMAAVLRLNPAPDVADASEPGINAPAGMSTDDGSEEEGIVEEVEGEADGEAADESEEDDS